MAELIAFPLKRSVGRARHVAALIARKSGRSRDTYYRVTCERLARQLRRIGFSEPEVRQQITAFTEAVNQAIAEGWRYDAPDDDRGHHRG